MNNFINGTLAIFVLLMFVILIHYLPKNKTMSNEPETIGQLEKKKSLIQAEIDDKKGEIESLRDEVSHLEDDLFDVEQEIECY